MYLNRAGRQLQGGDPRVITQPPTQPSQKTHVVQRRHARVTVDSTPRGAVATIDGTRVGPTPAAANVPPGRHHLVVEAAGYRRAAQPLEVRDEKPLTVNVTLEKEAAPRPPPKVAPPRRTPVPGVTRATPPPPPRPTPQDSDDGHKASPY